MLARFRTRQSRKQTHGTEPLLSSSLNAGNEPLLSAGLYQAHGANERDEPPCYNEAANAANAIRKAHEPKAPSAPTLYPDHFTVEPLSIQATFEELSEGNLKRAGDDDGDEVEVTVFKATKQQRFGLTMNSTSYGIATVWEVKPDSISARVLKAGDELIQVGPTRLLSDKPAELAVELLKKAAIGPITLRVRQRSERAVSSAVLLQERWRTLRARAHGVERRVIFKASAAVRLGLGLSPHLKHLSVVQSVKEESMAARVLGVGDLIVCVNGVTHPTGYETAAALREASGKVELLVVRNVPWQDLERGDVEISEERRMEQGQP